MARARLENSGGEVRPVSAGWFVLGAADVAWTRRADGEVECAFDGAERFSGVLMSLRALPAGPLEVEARCEDSDRDFLVLSGECLARVEDVEQPLGTWDRLHCPAGTPYSFVWASKTPCVVLEVGARRGPAEVAARVPGSVVLEELARRRSRGRVVAGVVASCALALLVLAVKFASSWARSEIREPEESALEAQRRVGDMLRQVDAVQAEKRRLVGECQRLVEEADRRTEEGDLDGAKDLLRRAIAIVPGDTWESEAQVRLGRLLRDEGRLEEAGVSFERACTISRWSAGSWYELGRIRESQGRLDEAIECYEKALAGYTSDPALKQAIVRALDAARAGREGR